MFIEHFPFWGSFFMLREVYENLSETLRKAFVSFRKVCEKDLIALRKAHDFP